MTRPTYSGAASGDQASGLGVGDQRCDEALDSTPRTPLVVAADTAAFDQRHRVLHLKNA